MNFELKLVTLGYALLSTISFFWNNSRSCAAEPIDAAVALRGLKRLVLLQKYVLIRVY